MLSSLSIVYLLLSEITVVYNMWLQCGVTTL